MTALFSNNAFSTLAGGITSGDTSITVTAGEGARFPAPTGADFFYATLIDTSNNLEIVKCTARATDTLTVTRAQESTTAAAYSAGDRIELRVTAAGLTATVTASAASAAAALVSETNAATSETNAAASFDTFDDRYLGAKASDPTLDNDGNALIDGAMYFDTTNNITKVYDLGTTTWLRTTPTAADQTNIDAVTANATNINKVAAVDTDVTAVAAIDTNVTTVAGISANVTTVAGISADTTTVAGVNADVITVAAIGTNITTVAGISGNVTTVAGISANTTTVAGISADVTTVAGISPDVSAVAAQVVGWNFSTTTTMVDPGAGAIRFNNATPASVTAIAVDDLDSNAADVSAYVISWDDSTNTDKGTLTIRQGTSFATFTITALTDNAGWAQLAVTYVTGSGTFADATLSFSGFSRSGDKGLDGAGSGTVTSVVTGGLATGGPITVSGTVTVAKAIASEVATGVDDAKAVTPLAMADALLGANNLSDVASAATSLSNIGGIGSLVADTTPQLGGFLDPNGKYVGSSKGADIVSASPLVVGTDGDMFDITGTTAFSVMTVATDRLFILQWDGAVTVTHGAAIVLPGGANVTTAAGDVWTCYSTAANTVIVTNIATATATAAAVTDNTARANIAINSFLIAAGQVLAAQNMVDGVSDVFSTQAGVDTVTSTNEIYDAAGDYYNNGSAGSNILIPATDGTTIGNLLASGGLAAAFDGSTATFSTRVGLTGFVGKDWGVGVAHNVDKYVIKSADSVSWTGNAVTTTDQFLYGSNTLPTAYNNGTLLHSNLGVANAPNTQYFNTVSTGITSGNFRFHWIAQVNASTADVWCAELEFYENLTPLNMTLVSNATTALVAPTDGFIVLWQEDVDVITLNTDLTVEQSMDGGTTWTTLTLIEEAILTTGRILVASGPLTSTSGTSMKWRIKTLNLKSQRIHAVWMEWS